MYRNTHGRHIVCFYRSVEMQVGVVLNLPPANTSVSGSTPPSVIVQLAMRMCIGAQQNGNVENGQDFLFLLQDPRTPKKYKFWGLSTNLDFLLICTVFLILGPFRGGGGGKTKFCGQEFMDTQTFLTSEALFWGPRGFCSRK